MALTKPGVGAAFIGYCWNTHAGKPIAKGYAVPVSVSPRHPVASSRLVAEHGPAGQPVWRNAIPLAGHGQDILARLDAVARQNPDRILITEPDGSSRRTLSYGAAARMAQALRQKLTAGLGLRKGDAVASLAPAGVDALLLKLACLSGGFVHVALPPFPFRQGGDNEEARALLATLPPKCLFAPAGHPALSSLGAVALDEVIAACECAEEIPADAAHDPADWAAIFFTSGSTGAQKGVPITRGMIASNQAAIAAQWPFLAEEPPVLVDWLPWHHVFGGLDNVFKVIWNGGTLHVDAAPSGKTMDTTVSLLADVAPTLHIGVPLGLKLLLDRLEPDEAAARAFTRRLRALFFAGAGIDAELWRRLTVFRERMAGFDILSGYGATEAASTICLSPAPLERPGELGHPLPGHAIKLAETDGRMELRVKGPNIAPCYLIGGARQPLPLDEDGFYRTGDAAVLRKREDGISVFAFDGRLAEDFKLSSGVKVRTGPLRAGLLAQCAPLAGDVVVAGENRDALVARVFLSLAGSQHPDVLQALRQCLGGWNTANPGSSTRIVRFDIATQPADRMRGELSDKGQIVQSRYLRNHADRFEALQAGEGIEPA